MNRLAVSLVLATGMTVSVSVLAMDKMTKIHERGVLKCGIHPGKAGFATPDAQGRWRGMDVDFCKALAAAVLGDPEKVEFITMSSKTRLTALVTDEIDVLSRTTTFTATRDGLNGVDTTTPWFYDGQAIMVKSSIGVDTAKGLNGATICTYPGTTSEKNINDFFESHNMSYKALIVEGSAEAKAAYLADRCDAITNDASALAANRLGMPNPQAHIILPGLISKEPLGAYVKQGENKWRQIVTWTAMALIAAEELGVTQDNTEDLKISGIPEVKRLLGSEGRIGENFGLKSDWALKAIKAVGNYGEIFERNVGAKTPLKLKRGLNALYSDGGLMYAYPFR
ncbi:MAG: ABC transporter substrate-binding protein [Osedax symbiont Rs1]|nr:MAG: ABC transporter substrate-binding protein [Osedax symbiont Rs1]